MDVPVKRTGHVIEFLHGLGKDPVPPPHKAQLSLFGRPGDGDVSDVFFFCFLSSQLGGDADAVVFRHHLIPEGVVADHHHRGLKSGLDKQGGDELLQIGRGIQVDEMLVSAVPQIHAGAAGQGMGLVHQQHHVVFIEGGVLDLGIVQGLHPVDASQIQVDLTRKDLVHVTVAFHRIAVDAHLGIEGGKILEDLGPNIRAQQAQIELAVVGVAQAVDGLPAVFQGQEGLLHIGLIGLPVGGKGDVAALADEEGRAQLGLQFFDGGAEGGLGDMELFGGFGNVFVGRQTEKIFQLQKIHGAPPET